MHQKNHRDATTCAGIFPHAHSSFSATFKNGLPETKKMNQHRASSSRSEHNHLDDEKKATIAGVLAQSFWFSQLADNDQLRVLESAREVALEAGNSLFHAGDSPKGWYGVMQGLLTWTAIGEDGHSLSMAGFSAGSWFGEASMIRAHPYEYHVFALRPSRLVMIPQETFEYLIGEQLVFSNMVLRHLAERVNFFMGTFSAQALANMNVKIARTLAAMFNKELHPRTKSHLHITQEEIANLCGVSRQRCNLVLKHLQTLGLIRVEYAGITVLDLDSLRQFGSLSRSLQ
jgi:CRP-like cAMP-binding protein